MYFHAVHGKNINLSTDSSQAKRSIGFCQSLTFSNQPLAPFQRITFQIGHDSEAFESSTTSLRSTTANSQKKKLKKAIWTGGLRIGLTSKNPITLTTTDLPLFSYPSLIDKDGFWITDLKSSYLKSGNKISLILDKDNSLQLYVNYVLKATLFGNAFKNSESSISKLWLILDLYGTTNSIQFLPSDLTPYEIKARGLDAVNNFHTACLSGGSKSIFKTRLIIVGQEGVGKSSLRNALVNLNHKKRKALGLNKKDGSTSFRVKIDSNSNTWNLKNINVSESVKKNLNKATNLYQTNSTHDIGSGLSNRNDSIKSNKRRSASTSYLNEEDDYDNDLNKSEYLKKLKQQLALDESDQKKSVSNSLKATLDPINRLQSMSESLETTEAADPPSSESDSENNSSIDSMENLFAIDECDEKIMPNNLEYNKNEFYYKEIAMNIYQELFTTKLYEKLWPSAIDTKNNTVNITETSNAAINNFTENFFEKLALVEFDMSIYNQLECSSLLRELYEKIVKNEIKQIQNKSNTIIVNPLVKIKNSDAQTNDPQNVFKNSLNKNLSLTILDFSGHSLFYTTHQIFLSSRAVYLICFDLSKDLDGLAHSNFEFGTKKNQELTNLDFLDFWMRSIHSHAAQMPDITTTMTNAKPDNELITNIQIDNGLTISLKNAVLSPPIIIVGTNKNNLSGNLAEQEEFINVKFAKIKEFVSNKIYFKHIVEPYMSVDASLNENVKSHKKEKATNLTVPEHNQKSDQEAKSTKMKDIHILKKVIELAAINEAYMGEQLPLRWLQFEKSLEKLKSKNLFYASLSQICEIAHEKEIKTQEELTTCLNFFHDLGNIIYYGNANDIFLRNTIILRPQKLVDIFKTVLNAKTLDHTLYLESQESSSQFERKLRSNPMYQSQRIGRTNQGNPLFSHSTTSLDNGQWTDLWRNYDKNGVLDERLLDVLLLNVIDQKPGLLGLMKKFDLICEKKAVLKSSNRENFYKEYLVPSRATADYDEEISKEEKKPSSATRNFYNSASQDDLRESNGYSSNSNASVIEFYYDFSGFLPESLFHRILTRASNWTLLKKGIKLQRAVKLYWRKARYQLDESHDFVIEMTKLKHARIKIQVIRLNAIKTNEVSEELPDTNACAKVRNFMESTLIDLRNLWMKRLIFNACVQCYCHKICHFHQIETCSYEDCIHFLNLDECLTNNVNILDNYCKTSQLTPIVSCDYRRVKTIIYKNWFPTQNLSLHKGPVLAAVKSYSDKNMFYDETNLPNWIKNVAKVISITHNQGHKENDKDKNSQNNHIITIPNENDWQALARLLGYTKSNLNHFMESKNPALQFLCDWIMSSDNTNLTIEFLLNYLEQIKREDACVIINNEREKDTVNSSVFISYQWDSQETVVKIKDTLEKAGFKCFMDIGQIGGGNLLYQKIDQAIRNAQVIIACITPKFVVSHFCNREMVLADLLRKPIVPIMLTTTPWPPPGGMSLIFSQLVYVDYYGVGGHGGCGILADRTQRNNEIIALVSRHIDPSSYFLMNIDRIVDNNQKGRSLKNSKTNKKLFDKRVSTTFQYSYSMNSENASMNYINGESQQPSATNVMRNPTQTNVSRCVMCSIL